MLPTLGLGKGAQVALPAPGLGGGCLSNMSGGPDLGPDRSSGGICIGKLRRLATCIQYNYSQTLVNSYE